MFIVLHELLTYNIFCNYRGWHWFALKLLEQKSTLSGLLVPSMVTDKGREQPHGKNMDVSRRDSQHQYKQMRRLKVCSISTLLGHRKSRRSDTKCLIKPYSLLLYRAGFSSKILETHALFQKSRKMSAT